MSFAIGIDPDTRDLAIAAWGGPLDGTEPFTNGPLAAGVLHGLGGYSIVDKMPSYGLYDILPLEPRYGSVLAVAIEGQQQDARRANPADLFKLAHMTGAALLWTRSHLGPDPDYMVPTPFEWKKSIQKHAMQARLYRELGWGYKIIGSGKGKYARPTDVPEAFTHISPGQWKHVGDALLLARWAYKKALPR